MFGLADSARSTAKDTDMNFDRITLNARVCGEKPCIRQLRSPMYQIVDLVAAGNSFEQILADYPYLEAEDIRQALAYPSYLTREEWVAV